MVESSGAEQNRRLRARAAVHAALRDPHRLAIVEALARSDRSPSELADHLGIGSNLLAHHVKVLEDVGLVEGAASGGDRRRRYLRLRATEIQPFAAAEPIRARNVVFVCTHNSARSQLAVAIWNQRHAVPATSAGTQPAERVHPQAVAAGARAGLDLRTAQPRSIVELDVDPDLVITVCDRAHEELAGWSRKVLHWSVPDPARDGRRTVFDATVRRLIERIAIVAPTVLPA